MLTCQNPENSLRNLRFRDNGRVPRNALLNEHCFSKKEFKLLARKYWLFE
eukprot:UN14153